MIQDNPSVILPVLQTLRKTFKSGITKSPTFRKQQLQNLLNGMQEMKNEMIEAIMKDLGYSDKFLVEFQQYSMSLEHCQHSIDNVLSWAKQRKVSTTMSIGPGSSYILPEPFGISLVVGAWNYPYQTSIPPVITSIAAGNCVILKPSEMSPNSSNVMAKLFQRYLNPICYSVVEGGIEVAKNITS